MKPEGICDVQMVYDGEASPQLPSRVCGYVIMARLQQPGERPPVATVAKKHYSEAPAHSLVRSFCQPLAAPTTRLITRTGANAQVTWWGDRSITHRASCLTQTLYCNENEEGRTKQSWFWTCTMTLETTTTSDRGERIFHSSFSAMFHSHVGAFFQGCNGRLLMPSTLCLACFCFDLARVKIQTDLPVACNKLAC